MNTVEAPLMHQLVIESFINFVKPQFHNSYVNLFSFFCMEGKLQEFVFLHQGMVSLGKKVNINSVHFKVMLY